ncbi:2-iminoacetate synthase (ThiH) [Mucinivorans hirudinis]|uniref:2-iminoacetate synthase (ThiH) n=1 Tax=Mucinivorans hirudinis TaxID=1433126 RepID=A0A060R701_9BACT|nr:2-iminoacetate synthase (ThiH) [Mucinivorans hirudinis]
MIFTPEKYAIEDIPNRPFIDADELRFFLKKNENKSVEQVINRAMGKHRLSLEEVAVLLGASPCERDKVLAASALLKEQIYGTRIVLFAPLYVGNLCTNRCAYCSFRSDNQQTVRKTLSDVELTQEIEALQDAGHKRLILVFGEHPIYSAEYIAKTVRKTYSVKKGQGEIRRVNINAAPLSKDDFAIVKQAGIGTYQVFQESYDPQVYEKYHLGGKKRDYNWRLTAFDRAMEAGIDDVGIGALLGLGDWRFEIMGLVRHANHLEACFGIGPHTISFPRINETLGGVSAEQPISDEDFIYAIAVLRLAVPYTGLILTARENPVLRNRAIKYGVSQIDGGTKLEIGSYSATEQEGTSQFSIHDNRSLAEIVTNLTQDGFTPSFCTACYRKGRTGEHFMEFSTKGFIKRFCTPNALLTFAEYLEDYADIQTKIEGWQQIEKQVKQLVNNELSEKLERVKRGERDILF